MADKLVLLCFSKLLFVLLFLTSSCVHGASLVEDKVWGSESGFQRGTRVQPAPNVDMMKALEYIQSLRQKTGTEPQQHSPHSTDRDGSDTDDAERLRDKSEELLQAVLSTLQQADKASPPVSLRPTAEEEGPKDSEYPRRQQKQHSIPLHKKLPLMFEDEEEEEDHLKRTNENVEEKYTPQNLATLQSVFDELDRLTSVRTMSKRLDEEDDPEGGEEEEEEMFNVRNAAYDDVDRDLPLDWGLLRDQEGKDDEEEENDKRDVDQDFDYVDNDKDETENAEEEEDEGYPVKRSKDPDDAANLVDYYLLKVLEKTEEEDNILPQNLYQIIKFSQKYKIPPEDVMNMLKAGQIRNQGRLQKTNKLSRVPNRFTQIPSKNVHKIPEASFYGRRLPYGQKSPEQLRTEEILKILGFDGAADRAPVREKTPYRGSLSRLHTQPAGRPGESTLRRFPTTLKSRYDNALDEDELAAYLAAKLPTQYLRPTYRARGQKRDDAGSFEQLIQNYFDHMDTGDQRQNEKRQSEPEGSFENEAVIKLLSYLSPETTEENSDDAKTVQG
uniref:Secretogranin II n=1 Tax=Cynoglossus semilaevis TaxID=244447 RepID=A0A3P8UZ77_CYNSE